VLETLPLTQQNKGSDLPDPAVPKPVGLDTTDQAVAANLGTPTQE
jgi:hypothetical protein